ncbi:hypothetical protein Y032_0256g363 [Ancylostoma ceylanicum]|uniref:Uncharacterized protein n=1 Tax=Ancylostoma ceylanicum TaxID=53326 RepID=A0A016SBV6_9BILA|nr:hypothetical protein Y032_0256g363 [Ancylostoma ceylanicum]
MRWQYTRLRNYGKLVISYWHYSGKQSEPLRKGIFLWLLSRSWVQFPAKADLEGKRLENGLTAPNTRKCLQAISVILSHRLAGFSEKMWKNPDVERVLPTSIAK